MVAIVTANLADICTFLLAMRSVPIEWEANPVARMLYAEAGSAGIVLLKAASLVLVLLLAGRLHRRLGGVGRAVAIALPLLGTVANTMVGLSV